MNKIFKFRFLGIVAFFAILAVFSVAAMFLWNALMPDIFGLPALNYWQAAGLVILARILFGGQGGLGRLGQRGHGGDERLSRNGNPLREKWLNMSEDERKEFMRSHGDFSHFHGSFDERSGERTNGRPNGGGRNRPDGEGVQNTEGKHE
jgi:hypothetical protein